MLTTGLVVAGVCCLYVIERDIKSDDGNEVLGLIGLVACIVAIIRIN